MVALTPIYHMNFDRNGSICCDILRQPHSDIKEGCCWNPATDSMKNVIIAVLSLMASPIPENPLSMELAEEYIRDPQKYLVTARRWTLQHTYTASVADEPRSFLTMHGEHKP
eukprot:GEMP01111207.1.p1 GENE.GEMP01111207.1~~GEMP01111207.1.p1  ORF type:complete len:112 (+),score=18.32 GEMP01111207.1:297-632(+)